MQEQTLSTNYEQAQSLLAQEESATNTDRVALAARAARREQFEQAYNTVQSEITRLWNRYRHLPDLPDQDMMDWAAGILAFPNLRFLVLDTSGADDCADIIRITVMDRHGQFTFDDLVRPGRIPLPQAANSRYTGIEADDFSESFPLSMLWHNFSEAVIGHYVLCYNTEFVQAHLNESAAHYGLPPIHLIGADLQEKARRFFENIRYYPLKLVDVAARIGHAMPTPATAPDRAAAQLAILKAIAEGNMGASQQSTSTLAPTNDDLVF